MTATISFLSPASQTVINNLAGSGLGFYGANFGASVAVGAYQQTTFITSADGTQQGPSVVNTTYLNAQSGQVGSETSGINLTCIPNWEAALNIRLTNATPVRSQNGYVLIYDRYSTANPASGVHTQVAEIAHPDTTEKNLGSGNKVWTTFSGVSTATGIQLNLIPSPGCSGQYATSAGDKQDVQHDHYLVISASPDTIGSKTQFGLYYYEEYL